jgi:hypothetical protein
VTAASTQQQPPGGGRWLDAYGDVLTAHDRMARDETMIDRLNAARLRLKHDATAAAMPAQLSLVDLEPAATRR